jgi:hypothetical protein
MSLNKLAVHVGVAMAGMVGTVRGDVVVVWWEEASEIVGMIRNLDELYSLKARLQDECRVIEA